MFELYGRDYLIVVDYYSKYPEICLMADKTAITVISYLKSIYSRHGIPNELFTNNMPFSSKSMFDFAQDCGFTVTTSSPTYPQSNGRSERCVQTVKKLMKKAEEDGKDPYWLCWSTETHRYSAYNTAQHSY